MGQEWTTGDREHEKDEPCNSREWVEQLGLNSINCLWWHDGFGCGIDILMICVWHHCDPMLKTNTMLPHDVFNWEEKEGRKFVEAYFEGKSFDTGSIFVVQTQF